MLFVRSLAFATTSALAALFTVNSIRAQVPDTPAPISATPPAATPPTVAAVGLSDAEIIRNGQGSLVFVEGKQGAGSGFICTMGSQKYLFTNAHVLAGNTPVTLTLLDGSAIKVGASGVAVGHDIVRLAVAANQPSFELLEKPGENLLVGDDVLVLGNTKGARVVTPIAGKVVGIGPNLVEVNAPFQPGNSGSPIIQRRTGRVVGIATYARDDSDNLENRPAPSASPSPGGAKDASTTQKPPGERKLRRFGYRLDTVKTWQDINWPEFTAEAVLMQGLDERTEDLERLIKYIDDHKGTIRNGAVQTQPVDRLVTTFLATMQGRPSPSDALRIRVDFLDGLRRVAQSDIAEARPKLRYDYFARGAIERQRDRDELAKIFENSLKAQK